MPRMGRSTLPNWMIWLTELRMMSTGTANPTPLLAPDGEYIAVLMPAGSILIYCKRASADRCEGPSCAKSDPQKCVQLL